MSYFDLSSFSLTGSIYEITIWNLYNRSSLERLALRSIKLLTNGFGSFNNKNMNERSLNIRNLLSLLLFP